MRKTTDPIPAEEAEAAIGQALLHEHGHPLLAGLKGLAVGMPGGVLSIVAVGATEKTVVLDSIVALTVSQGTSPIVMTHDQAIALIKLLADAVNTKGGLT